MKATARKFFPLLCENEKKSFREKNLTNHILILMT